MEEDDIMARIYTFDEVLRLIARRRWFILLPFAFGLAAAPLLARYAPERYRSEALIVVVPQRVPDNYVKPTVSETIEERLSAITDHVLSRSRLERIIMEMNLYKAERARDVMEDVVLKMRQDISTTPGGKEIDSFRVSYVSINAQTTQKVTERLASLYIEQNLKDRENQADSTSRFLATQLDEAKRRLIEQEKKLEDYRRSHAGQLPSQLQSNLQSIQSANLQLQSLNESTKRAQERRLLVERQIADIQSVPLPVIPLSPTTSEAPPRATAAEQLDVARARLASLLQRYTLDHPDVVSLQRTIGELVTQLERETPTSATVAPEKPLTVAEAAQRKQLLDLQAELAVIDHQLNANHKEEADLKQAIAAYQAKVDVVPRRESELVELTRDYSTLQAAYATLLTKREEANLERRQIGEQFKLLHTASLPERPYNQLQRRGIVASGAAIGLLLGLLIVWVKEVRDSSFRREEEVHKALSVPVLALIPIMSSTPEHRATKRRRRAIDLAGTAVLVASCLVLVIWRLYW